MTLHDKEIRVREPRWVQLATVLGTRNLTLVMHRRAGGRN
jgi:hypothetical protein